MDLIKERSFQRLLQETSEYKRNEMNYVKDSYWEDMESNYGIEEYIYQNVHELADKIEKATQISSDVSKDLAVEAYRIFLRHRCCRCGPWRVRTSHAHPRH